MNQKVDIKLIFIFLVIYLDRPTNKLLSEFRHDFNTQSEGQEEEGFELSWKIKLIWPIKYIPFQYKRILLD